MPDQPWNCENCGNAGSVEHREHAGLFEVIIQIADAHRAASVGCHGMNGLEHVRAQAVEEQESMRV